MPRKLAPARKPRLPRRPLPDELAKDAIAHEQPGPSGRVRLRVDLPKALAEALAAEATRREMNLPAFVTELLEVAATRLPNSRSGGP